EVLQNSSNVGAIKIGLAVGKERYYKYIAAFGFGAPAGVGLGGESRGQLRPPSKWSGLSLATMSIGQEISVTALQVVNASAAIAREALRYLNVPPRDTSPVPLERGEVIAGLPAASARPGDSLDAPRMGTWSLELAEDASAVMPRVERLSLRQAMEMLAPFDV